MKPITANNLQQIATKLTPQRAAILAPLINQTCDKYGIATYLEKCAFIATIIEESGEFTRYDENLNYSVGGLMKTWPKRFPTVAAATFYAHDPQALANHVYCDRLGNGSEASGEGWLYRGSGAIQTTGKAMMLGYARYIKQDVRQVADWMRTTDRWAIDSAGYYCTVQNKNCMALAAKGDFVGFTRSVNGGNINMETRYHYYNLALAALK